MCIKACPGCGSNPRPSPTFASYEALNHLAVAVGTVLTARPHENARKPMLILEIDFGPVGIKTTAAMVTDLYTADTIVGRQIVGVTGLPPKRIAGVVSQVLLLAGVTDAGSVLLTPDRPVGNGVSVR